MYGHIVAIDINSIPFYESMGLMLTDLYIVNKLVLSGAPGLTFA